MASLMDTLLGFFMLLHEELEWYLLPVFGTQTICATGSAAASGAGCSVGAGVGAAAAGVGEVGAGAG